MTKSLFRTLAAACASALALGTAPVHASTVTLTNIACDDVVVGGVPGARTLTCTTSTSPPPTSGGAPTGCSLSASPSGLTASGLVTLTAACSGGGAPNSYAWSGSGVVASTTVNQQSITVSATTTFYVTPSSNGVAGNQASATVTVSSAPPPAPPPPTSGGACGNYAAVEMGAVQMNGVGVLSKNFGNNTVAIASFTVPGGYPMTTNTIAIFEYIGAPTYRKAWMSKTRCDMSAASPPYFLSSDGPVFSYTIGGTDPNAVRMQPGETWYVMIVNERPWGLGSSCFGSCDIGIKWYPPLQ